MESQRQRPWRERWRERMEDMAARSDTAYWNRRAPDYNDFINTSRFDYGERLAEILQAEGVLDSKSRVLEIAAGVGATTLPLARRASRVTAVEPAESMAELLFENAREARVANLDVEVEDFAAFAEKAPDKSFDVVFLCHASWQFPDMAWLLGEMSRLSRSWCCLADTLGQGDAENRTMHERLGIDPSGMDRTLYVYNILSEIGMPANLTSFPHTMRRSADSARAMWRNLLGKYREPTPEDLKIIDGHVAEKSLGGVYEAPGAMALAWWRSK